MYAIVDIAGQQFKAEKGKSLFVHRMQAEEGSAVEFDKILLLSEENNVRVSDLGNIRVRATVVSHLKGDKVIVFKKKRRKGYKVKRGHRQSFTKVQIEDILV